MRLRCDAYVFSGVVETCQSNGYDHLTTYLNPYTPDIIRVMPSTSAYVFNLSVHGSLVKLFLAGAPFSANTLQRRKFKGAGKRGDTSKGLI